MLTPDYLSTSQSQNVHQLITYPKIPPPSTKGLWKHFPETLWGVRASEVLATTTPLLPGVALVTQSYPTLCNPMDCSLPGFSVHGILQARTLEWVAIPFSRTPLLVPYNKHCTFLHHNQMSIDWLYCAWANRFIPSSETYTDWSRKIDWSLNW